MAFLTEAAARAAVQNRGVQFAESEIRKSAATDLSTTFDVFLSHSFLDADLVVGIKELLEGQGLSVYIDWVEDQQLNRTQVTAKTAGILRTRMRNSRSLIFATSSTSSGSKWMPWELGYFDGFRPNHAAIFPLVKTSGSGFPGQEYLGLYPYVEVIAFEQGPRQLGISTSDTTALPISGFPTHGVRPPSG